MHLKMSSAKEAAILPGLNVLTYWGLVDLPATVLNELQRLDNKIGHQDCSPSIGQQVDISTA